MLICAVQASADTLQVTTKLFPLCQVISKDIDHLYMSGDEEERKSIQQTSHMFAAQITQLLFKVPRVLLLLLKTNDCLRSVDLALGEVSLRSFWPHCIQVGSCTCKDCKVACCLYNRWEICLFPSASIHKECKITCCPIKHMLIPSILINFQSHACCDGTFVKVSLVLELCTGCPSVCQLTAMYVAISKPAC